MEEGIKNQRLESTLDTLRILSSMHLQIDSEAHKKQYELLEIIFEKLKEGLDGRK